jgi:hypothetical protein
LGSASSIVPGPVDDRRHQRIDTALIRPVSSLVCTADWLPFAQQARVVAERASGDCEESLGRLAR